MNTRILPSQDTVAFGQVFHTAARIAETCEEYLQSAVEHVVGHSTREFISFNTVYSSDVMFMQGVIVCCLQSI